MIHDPNDFLGRTIKDPIQLKRARAIMANHEWNLARMDARSILYEKKREIQKYGGADSRFRGVRLIERILRRLIEWVDE